MVVFLLLAILVVLLIATGLWPIAIAAVGLIGGGILLFGATAFQGWEFWAPVLTVSAVIFVIKIIKPLERLKQKQQAAADAQERQEKEQQRQHAVDDKAARKEAAIRAQVEATNNIGNRS